MTPTTVGMLERLVRAGIPRERIYAAVGEDGVAVSLDPEDNGRVMLRRGPPGEHAWLLGLAVEQLPHQLNFGFRELDGALEFVLDMAREYGDLETPDGATAGVTIH
jgi:hypothetical protein